MIDSREAALEALDDEDYAVAEQHLRDIMADEPDDGVALGLLALVVLAQERLDEATELARGAVTTSPESAFTHRALGSVLLARNRFPEALEEAQEAIRLDPEDSDHRALEARAYGAQSRWADALVSASRGLRLDSEHVPSASMRALALRQLGRTAEADAAFDDVAGAAPLDTFANAGRAWMLLRRGDREDALEQFREALRLDPTNAWARDGMLASLKARHPVYRLFLKYYLWLETRTQRQQLMYTFLGIFLYSNMRRLARAEPQLAPVLWPLMALYVLFVLGSWIADPLFDLLLRFDAVGRRALTPERRRASSWVGICLFTAIAAGIVTLLTGSHAALNVAICGAFLLIPLAGTFSCEPGWPRNIMTVYTAALAVAAVFAALLPDRGGSVALFIVVLGAAVGSWLARWLQTVIPAR
ncbi:MAG: tetratricopeptide repeat protein [Anaerolineae bacterium]|nr:tetratricopeptide repeat protein [Gemmatimonadaceae bacterium]